jgi:hypothetical protein
MWVPYDKYNTQQTYFHKWKEEIERVYPAGVKHYVEELTLMHTGFQGGLLKCTAPGLEVHTIKGFYGEC